MNAHRATQIAMQCIEAEIKRLNANANLEDAYHAGIPACVKASARRKELREAIATLKEPMQVGMKL